MTEAEWLWAATPAALLGQLVTTSRKKRLYCVACCWRVAVLNEESGVRDALEVAERYADGWETRRRLDAAREQCGWPSHFVPFSEPRSQPIVANAIAEVCQPGTLFNAEAVLNWISQLFPHQTMDDEVAEFAAQRDLLNELFGNPFCPVAFAPQWRTDTAVTLARQMYEVRDFSAMPILADALQDAGCDNEDVLNHCRDPQQTHVRGVLDRRFAVGQGIACHEVNYDQSDDHRRWNPNFHFLR